MDLCEGVKRDLGSGRDLGMALLASPEPKLSVPDFVLQLWSKICTTNPMQNGKPGFEAQIIQFTYLTPIPHYCSN